MKNLLKKAMDVWRNVWLDDESDTDKHHLSQSDKRSLLYGCFLVNAGLVVLVCIGIFIGDAWSTHRSNKETEELFGYLATYLATATDDEYEEIAETIRHDLVYSEYCQDIDNIIQYIPNTADVCCLEREAGFIERANVVFLNTGETYGLDIYDSTESVESQQQMGGTRMTSGYDEISGATLTITSTPSEGTSTARLDNGRGIVSVHKMKSLFCDDCIRKILELTDGEYIRTAVIYDAETQEFYPISDGDMEIGDYSFHTYYEDGTEKIDIKYLG